MTREEHILMILLLTRVNQHLRVIEEALKSRDIVTEEDLKAFYFAAWDDPHQIVAVSKRALSDYRKMAKEAGVQLPSELEQDD